MAKSPITCTVAVLVCFALMGASCQPQKSTDEFRIALRQLKEEQIQKCTGLGEAPENSTGDLLQDYADLAQVAATCKIRHNTLIDYLKPLVEKAKQPQ